MTQCLSCWFIILLVKLITCNLLTGLHIEQQLEVMERFREGEHLCIVATSVACEGLDIPQCNLMIRYKFRADVISSYQMRGNSENAWNKKGQTILLMKCP